MTEKEVISLEKYVDRLLVEQREYFLSRIIALEKATELAAGTLEKRLEGMNEFREALKEQNATFATRGELRVFRDTVEADVRILRESKANLEGKASQQSVNNTKLVAYVALIVGVVSLIVKLLG